MSMFLLPGLLTLAVLGRTVVASPQDSIVTNTTASITSIDIVSLVTSETPEAENQEIDPCMINFNPKSCGGARERPELPTATGFDDTELNSFVITPSTQVNLVVTSNMPTIIDIETNTIVRGGPVGSLTVGGIEAEKEDGPPNTAVQKEMIVSSSVPTQSVGIPTGKTPPMIVLSSSQQAPQNSLLSDVVSRLGHTDSNTQPTSTSLGTTNALDEDSPVQSVTNPREIGVTPGPSMPTATSPAPGVTGNSITLGSATLTLTPGVSATIGPNSDQTFIAIATNAAGSTLVTISSSGIAITATVSTTPTIVTLPKTRLGASITNNVHAGHYTGKLSTTTSQGLAVENKRNKLGWWTSAMLGFFGFAFGL